MRIPCIGIRFFVTGDRSFGCAEAIVTGDRPGVLTVLPGARGEADLRDLLSYLDATPEERDYSVLADMAPQSREARCVYCNHCQPCPAGIQIGLVNKYYDLALVGDELAAEHYRNLEHHAGECIGCGHCDSRCPFGGGAVRAHGEDLGALRPVGAWPRRAAALPACRRPPPGASPMTGGVASLSPRTQKI